MPVDVPYTDNKLVQLLTESNREAFELIYNKYWWPLYNSVYKRLQDKAKSEDLVQEVFYKLWKNREKLRIEHLEAYLKTAARYETLNYLARTQKTYAFFEPFQDLLMERDQPDTQLFTKDLLELIQQYADTLPEKRREIFLLHIHSRLSTKEIAEKLGLSQKTVQNQIGNALNGLKTRIIPIVVSLLAEHYS